MYIPENKISEILNACDIVDVIAESVILKKTGRNYLGLCPFHSEKTPSFSVSPQKQIFHCFGCGVGGNVFSFLMKHNGISFPEAVKLVAKRYSIEMADVSMSPMEKKKLEMREAMFMLNNKVMGYYSECLRKSKNASMARHYLEKRGISRQIQDLFCMGYAANDWESLVNFLKNLKLDRDIVEASGLVLRKKNSNGYYDRFRNRIIFPIIDVNMQVAGFGGRVMDNAMPKYLNSPETIVYSKSRILYGLHAAKQYCRQTKSVYIVEGYFDFLSLYQHGVKNVVASLGTALTSEHVRLLKGYASKMILVFDSDNAGINAAKRSITTFVKHGVDVRIVVLPEGDDPDSFVCKYGGAEFQNVAAKAMSAIAFLTKIAIQKHGLSFEGKINILDEVKSYIAGVDDSVAKSLYIKELSETLGIDEKAVMEKVRQAIGKGDRRADNSRLYDSDGEALKNEVNRENRLESDRREIQILSLMLQYDAIRAEVKSRDVINFFYSDRLKKIGRLINEINGSGNFVANVMACAENDDDRELIASLAMKEIPETEHLMEKSIALMNRIIKVRNKTDNIITNQIKKAEQDGNFDLPIELLKQRQREIRKLRGYE